MKAEQDIKDAITQIQLQDQQCPSTAHRTGGVCMDVGHAIRGTWLAALWWALDLGDPPW